MADLDTLNELLAFVVHEQDADAALQRLNAAALELTWSRNSMIAQLNDELGCLEIRHGIGREWELAQNETLKVDINTKEGIVAYVAATGKSFMTGNVEEEKRYKNLFGTTKSELAVPIRDRHLRIRAVLNLESDLTNAYTEETLKVCEYIALLASVVLERQEAHTREAALLEISKSLDQVHTEEELINGVIRVAGEVLSFQAFSLFLLDPQTDTYVLKGSVGLLKDKIGQIRYRRGEGLTGWVCETGMPVLLANPQKAPRWRGLHVEFPSEEIASFIAVPVMWRGKAIGVIRALRHVTDNEFLDNRFTVNDQQVLIAVAEHLATVIDNIRNLQKLVNSERMVAWGELSAKSSHMIGNRIFALKGDVNEFKHLLAAKPLDLGELNDIQHSLTTNISRVEEILQEFRDFLTATQLKKEMRSLNDLIEQTAGEVFPKRSEVALQLELEPDLPEVSLDEVKLRRALSELIENALIHSPKGTLRIATSIASQADLRLSGLRPGGSYVKIEVEDSGPGVLQEDKSSIFQPFFSRRVKGMGLGLSIVKGIVDGHGGAIHEAGLEGSGAKFVILLPLLERSKSEKS